MPPASTAPAPTLWAETWPTSSWQPWRSPLIMFLGMFVAAHAVFVQAAWSWTGELLVVVFSLMFPAMMVFARPKQRQDIVVGSDSIEIRQGQCDRLSRKWTWTDYRFARRNIAGARACNVPDLVTALGSRPRLLANHVVRLDMNDGSFKFVSCHDDRGLVSALRNGWAL